MSDGPSDIPVKVEVDEEEKTGVVPIPWDRLGRVDAAACRAWLTKADAVRKEWAARGYRCN
ncbi:MAG TPA: hypothetical protein VEA69_08485 [Tepidisphaeraceae bacterium]|nr:hypothetical protein [Tepidisphaeraceae bacterium]